MADAKRIVRIDYKAYFADADRLYDTTNADAAKEAGIFNEKVTYAPMAYIIGSGSLYADLDAAIAGAEIGKETEVTIPCEKAAGARNPRLIELHPIKEFYKNEINPYPGMSVSLGNRNGVVMSVGAGRVKVDFNNPLAGHDLKYEVTVVEEVTDPVEKAKCIMEMDFGTSEGFGFGIMVQVPRGLGRRQVQARLGLPQHLRSRPCRVRPGLGVQEGRRPRRVLRVIGTLQSLNHFLKTPFSVLLYNERRGSCPPIHPIRIPAVNRRTPVSSSAPCSRCSPRAGACTPGASTWGIPGNAAWSSELSVSAGSASSLFSPAATSAADKRWIGLYNYISLLSLLC